MHYDLVDRRRSRHVAATDEDEEADDSRDSRRSSAWRSVGIRRDSGSPELADHHAAHLLIDAACAAYSANLSLPVSHRTLRWHTLSGPRSRTVDSPTRSRRYGVQSKPERNLRVYLLCEVLGLTTAEAGRRVGLRWSGAKRAKKMGARLAASFALREPDPRLSGGLG